MEAKDLTSGIRTTRLAVPMFPNIVDSKRIEATGDGGLIRSLQIIRHASSAASKASSHTLNEKNRAAATRSSVPALLKEVRSMIHSSKSEDSLHVRSKRARLRTIDQTARKSIEHSILESDMRRLDESVRRLYPYSKCSKFPRQGSIIGGLGAFTTTLIPSRREAPQFHEWRDLTRVLRVQAMPKRNAVPVIQSWYRGCKQRERWKRKKSLLYYVATRFRYRARRMMFKRKWKSACEFHRRTLSRFALRTWATEALKGKLETLKLVTAFKLKRLCGAPLLSWHAHTRRCIRLRHAFKSAHRSLAAVVLFARAAHLRFLAHCVKRKWASYAKTCVTQRRCLSKVFITCIPCSFDNSSMQIMLRRFADNMWKRIGARRYFAKWKQILLIRAEELSCAIEHYKCHASTKYGSPHGRISILAKYFYTCERVIASPNPAPEAAYDVKYNFGLLPSALIHWVAWTRAKMDKMRRYELADGAHRPMGMRRGIRALKKHVQRARWMVRNLPLGENMHKERTLKRVFAHLKQLRQRRKKLFILSQAYGNRNTLFTFMQKWLVATRSSILRNVVRDQASAIINHAEETWFACVGDAHRNRLMLRRGIRGLRRRVAWSKDMRRLEHRADIAYRNSLFKKWAHFAKTHFEYVYAALVIQNRIRIRLSKRILRSKVRMVLAKQAVHRDKLAHAVGVLGRAVIPFQKLWRGHRGREDFRANEAELIRRYDALQELVRQRAMEKNRQKEIDLESFWEAELNRNAIRSAVYMQAWYRAWRDRKGIIKELRCRHKLTPIRENIAARRLQHAALRRRRITTFNATTIQRWLRGTFARLYVRKERKWQRYDAQLVRTEKRASKFLRYVLRLKSHRVVFGIIGVLEMMGIIRVVHSENAVQRYHLEERDRIWRRQYYNDAMRTGTKLEKLIARVMKKTVHRAKSKYVDIRERVSSLGHPLESKDLPPVVLKSIGARDALETYAASIRFATTDAMHLSEIKREMAAITIQRHFRLQNALLKYKRYSVVQYLGQDRLQKTIKKCEFMGIKTQLKQYTWIKRLVRFKFIPKQTTGRTVNRAVTNAWRKHEFNVAIKSSQHWNDILTTRRLCIDDRETSMAGNWKKRRNAVHDIKSVVTNGFFFSMGMFDQSADRGGKIHFEGCWAQGKPWGYGTATYAPGNSRKFSSSRGTWYNGILSGACFISLSHGGTYHGEISVSGNMHGIGKLVFPYVREDHEWECGIDTDDDTASSVSDDGCAHLFLESNNDTDATKMCSAMNKTSWGMTIRRGTAKKKGEAEIDDENNSEGAMPKRIWNLRAPFSLSETFPFRMTDDERMRVNPGWTDLSRASKVSLDDVQEISMWNIYDGEWIDGEYEGKGLLRLADGTRYTGKFKEGRYEGSGTLRFSDGSHYAGEFSKGARSGKGRFQDPCGNWYEGYWHKGKPNGQGTSWRNDKKELYVGQYVKGKMVGRIMVHYENGDRRAGTWSTSGDFVEWLHKRISVQVTNNFCNFFRVNKDFESEFALSVLGIYESRSHMKEGANRMPDHVDHEDLRVQGIVKKIKLSSEAALMLEGRMRLHKHVKTLRKQNIHQARACADAEAQMNEAKTASKLAADGVAKALSQLTHSKEVLLNKQFECAQTVARCDELLSPLWERVKTSLFMLRTYHATTILNYSTPPDYVNICMQLCFTIWKVHYGSSNVDDDTSWADATKTMFYLETPEGPVPTIKNLNSFSRFNWKKMELCHVDMDFMAKISRILEDPACDPANIADISGSQDQGWILGAMWRITHAWLASAKATVLLAPVRECVKSLQSDVVSAEWRIKEIETAATNACTVYKTHRRDFIRQRAKLSELKEMLEDAQRRIVEGRLSEEDERRRNNEALGLVTPDDEVAVEKYEFVAASLQEAKQNVALEGKRVQALHAEHKIYYTRELQFANAIQSIEKRRRPPLEEAKKDFSKLSRDNFVSFYELGQVPPRSCVLAAKAVCGLLGSNHATWADLRRRMLIFKDDARELSGKKAYVNPDFIASILKFDVRNINPVSAYQITKMVKQGSMSPELIKNDVLKRKGEDSDAWIAGAALAKWALAIENYCNLEREIDPFRLNLREAVSRKDSIDDSILNIEIKLQGFQERHDELEREHAALLTIKNRLKAAEKARFAKISALLEDEDSE